MKDFRCTLDQLVMNNMSSRILYFVFEITNVSRFIANLRIGRISSNSKKKQVEICEFEKLVNNLCE